MILSPIPTQGSQSFQKTLEAGRFVITAEITPPASCNAEDLLHLARPLKGVADAVNVTDGAGAHAQLSALAAAAILAEEGIEPILQMVCRDRNRIALQADLMGAAVFHIRNLLILRGDKPDAGDQPEAKAVFDLDPVGLLQTARNLRDRQELPNGRRVAGEADFFLGAADLPIDPSGEWNRLLSWQKLPQERASCRRSSVWTRRSCAVTWKDLRNIKFPSNFILSLASHRCVPRALLGGCVNICTVQSLLTDSSSEWTTRAIHDQRGAASR